MVPSGIVHISECGQGSYFSTIMFPARMTYTYTPGWGTTSARIFAGMDEDDMLL